jgi:hypothetical protein
LKIKCLHGYFIFEEEAPGEISDFMNRFGFDIEGDGDIYTFGGLVGAPDFSLPGLDYLGYTMTEKFEGKPWEIFEANGVVFNFLTGEIVPIETITKSVRLSYKGDVILANGMILPGSITDEGTKVTDYLAYYSDSRLDFKYTEISGG